MKSTGLGIVGTLLVLACGGATEPRDAVGGEDRGIVLVDIPGLDQGAPEVGPADVPAPVDTRVDPVPCTTAVDCPAGYPICVESLGTCGRCTPDQKMCSANTVRRCSPDAMGWIDFPCPALCRDGLCVVCIAGREECADNTARKCNADGSAWEETPCGELTCIGGKCLACEPGTQQCLEDQAMRCKDDGSGWELQQDCDTETTGLVCQGGTCRDLCEQAAGLRSNLGCEYWAVDLDQPTESDALNSPYAVVVSNVHATLTAWVTVTTNEGEVKKVQAPPMTATIVDLPARNVVGVVKDLLAYRVKSNLPVVAYQFNPLENVGVFSNDASLLLPTNVLGKGYRVMAWPHRTGGDGTPLPSFFAVVGTSETPTSVTVKVSAATVASTAGVGGTVPALNAGATWTTTLARHEVLNLETRDAYGDLTGSTVESDQPVAVFGGHVCANAPLSRCKSKYCTYDGLIECQVDADCPIIAACDHLEEQLQPVSAWGRTYVIGRSWPRGVAKDIVRVLASQAVTKVTVDPAVATIPTLNVGQTFEFEIDQNVLISADKPVLVGQFLEGQNAPFAAHSSCADGGPLGKWCDGAIGGKACQTDEDCYTPDDANIGDPSFIVGVPVEQYRQEYVFLVPTKYALSYVNVTAPPDAEVYLDGNLLTLGWTPLPGGAWAVAMRQLKPGSHTVSADRKVGIVVYGWDQYVSYGYPGGMNLEALPQ